MGGMIHSIQFAWIEIFFIANFSLKWIMYFSLENKCIGL